MRPCWQLDAAGTAAMDGSVRGSQVGTSAANWNLVDYRSEVGAIPKTVQEVVHRARARARAIFPDVWYWRNISIII